jgi:subtilase family serine protease
MEGQGFQVEGVPASRNQITVRGTAQQVESALHTEMHRYMVNGRERYANAGDPSVPAALTVTVLSIRGLNNFQLKPRAMRKVSPRFTSGISGNHFITPGDFAAIYDVSALYAKGFNGAGQKIVVVGQSDVALSDIQAFRNNSGLPVNNPQPTNSTNSSFVGLVVPGDKDPGMQSGDIDEANLDVEWAGAAAPMAAVTFIVGDPVNAGGVFDALNYAITTSPIPAPIISTSYGACEADFAPSDISFLQSLAQQANVQGITILAPSGDSGAADCDNNSDPNNPLTASTLGLAVDLPGSLPGVTSIGGTEFAEGADTAGAFWTNPACVRLGTCSVTPSPDMTPTSARSYIVPEGAWNDTSVQLGLTAGGGGASSVIPKPAWQAGTGVPNDGARDVPDISFNASPVHDSYLICSENFNASANPQFTPSCVNGFRDGINGNLTAVGGTSIGPPAFAGIVALINQATGHSTGSGNINTVLYPLAARVSAAAFHDITSGSNQVPFSATCAPTNQIGYSATAGYDLATGLGSIDALNLVTNWTTVTPASTATATSSVNFSLAFSPTQMTVKRGACGTGQVQLTRTNGFVGTPTFTCTVAAALGATTCSVVPVTSGGLYQPGNYRELGWWGIVGFVLAGAAFVLVTFKRSGADDPELGAWPRLVPGLVLMTLLAIVIGCGSSSSSGSPTASNLPVNYAFTVAVPSTAPVASAAVTVNAAIGGISRTAQIVVSTQ